MLFCHCLSFRLNISQQSSGGSPTASPSTGDRFSLSYTDSSHRRPIKRKRFNASDDSLYYRNTAKSYKVFLVSFISNLTDRSRCANCRIISLFEDIAVSVEKQILIQVYANQKIAFRRLLTQIAISK